MYYQANSLWFARVSGRPTIGDLWKNYHAIGMPFFEYTIHEDDRNLLCSAKADRPVDRCCTLLGSNFNLLNQLKSDARRNLQPMKVHENHCTLLLLENLAMPEWLSVKCNQNLLDTVICSQPEQKLVNTSTARRRTSADTGTFCLRNEIKFQKKCLSAKYLCSGTDGKFCPESNLNTKGIPLFLLKLFDKDNQHPIVFSSQLNFSECEEASQIHSKYQNTKIMFTRKPCNYVHGITFCQSNQQHLDMNTIYFLCNSSEIISQTLLCDGIGDCLSKDDELNCNCSDQNQPPTDRCNVAKVLRISNIYLKNSVNGTHRKISDFLHVTFICNNSGVIPMAYFDDGYPDCYGADDEYKFNTSIIHSMLANNLCKNPAEIQCYEGFDRCFPLAKVCFCEVDHFGNLETCRNGYHLTMCHNFECNAAYKCQESYCIPYEYKCNGKWECLNGEDELNCQNLKQHCAGLFKCMNSSICIFSVQICNGEEECPMGSDELLCVPPFAKCPQKCSCFQLTAVCSKIKNLHILEKNLLQFCTHIHFLNSTVENRNLQRFESVLAVAILGSNMERFCQHMGLHVLKLQFLSVEKSYLESVISACFKGTKSILKLILRDLRLKAIEDLAFVDQLKLSYLDLSNNLLTVLRQPNLCFLIALKGLNISGNRLQKFSTELFEGLQVLSRVQTDYFAICCATLSMAITCTAHVQWPFSCQDILNKTMTIFLWHVGIILLIIGRFSDNIVFRRVGIFIYLFFNMFVCLFVCL